MFYIKTLLKPDSAFTTHSSVESALQSVSKLSSRLQFISVPPLLQKATLRQYFQALKILPKISVGS